MNYLTSTKIKEPCTHLKQQSLSFRTRSKSSISDYFVQKYCRLQIDLRSINKNILRTKFIEQKFLDKKFFSTLYKMNFIFVISQRYYANQSTEISNLVLVKSVKVLVFQQDQCHLHTIFLNKNIGIISSTHDFDLEYPNRVSMLACVCHIMFQSAYIYTCFHTYFFNVLAHLSKYRQKYTRHFFKYGVCVRAEFLKHYNLRKIDIAIYDRD